MKSAEHHLRNRLSHLMALMGLFVLCLTCTGVVSSQKVQKPTYNINPSLVEVRGGTARDQVIAAIEALGGIERFVKPGQRVLLKPTVAYAASPEEHKNTDPAVLMAVIRLCQKAGAAHVYVVDFPFDDWKLVYRMSQLERATKITGNKPLPVSEKAWYSQAVKPAGKISTPLYWHTIAEQCDVAINLTRSGIGPSGRIFGSFENYSGLLWNRGRENQTEATETILNLHKAFPPVLSLIETSSLPNHGQSEDEIPVGFIAASDWMAAESWLYSTLGQDPLKTDYLLRAASMQLGCIETDRMSIEKIWIDEIKKAP